MKVIQGEISREYTTECPKIYRKFVPHMLKYNLSISVEKKGDVLSDCAEIPESSALSLSSSMGVFKPGLLTLLHTVDEQFKS